MAEEVDRLDNDQYTDAGHVVAFVYMLYVSCPWCRPTICAFFEHSLYNTSFEVSQYPDNATLVPADCFYTSILGRR
jgi:hypothetical protein